jgi:MFS family permease
MTKRLLLAVLLIAQTMASMDGSIANVALPSIQRDLGATGAVQQLVVSGYLLMLASLIVAGARLGDLVGHRRAFQWGLTLFTAASLACGLAWSPTALVGARALQGAGAALLIPQVFSLIQLHFRGAARRRAVGLYSMVLALGVALGQVLGGVLASADLFGTSWRPLFLVNVPVGMLLIAAARWALPRTEESARLERRLDVPGALALALGLSAFTAPLTLGREADWPWWTWLGLGASAVLLTWFAWHQGRAPLPLLDLEVLRPRGMRTGLTACTAVMGCYAAFLFAFTLHLQNELGRTPLAAGLAFLPYAIGFGIMSLTWARMPERAVAALPVAGPLVLGGTAVAVAVAAAAGDSPWFLTPLLALGGAGHAAGYGPLIARLSDLVPPGRASAFSALNSSGPVLGQTVAVAAIGGVYLRAGLVWALGTIAAVLAAGAVCAAVSGRAIGSARADSPGRPAPGAAVAARRGGVERSTSN